MSEHFQLPWPAEQRRLRAGVLEIDLRYRRVIRPDGEVELAQRVFDLLLLFLSQPGVLQTRSEIFRQVWPGLVVEDANLTQSIWLLRRALGAEAKDWIRTVAKLGYVFDPPQPVEWAPHDTPATAAEPVPAAAAPMQVPARTAAPMRRFLSWRPAVLALACLLLLLVGIDSWKASAQAPQRIVLAAATDGALDEAAQWPVQLLQSWLEWKLRSGSEVELGHASDAGGQRDDVVVLLAVGPADGNGEGWQLSARLRGAGYTRDIVRTAAANELMPALDQLSRDVHLALAPEAAAQPWPALKLDSASAMEFVSGLRDEQRHRRGGAVQHYRAALSQHPDFGYARWRLALDLAELGQQGAAEAELAHLRDWVAQLPSSVRQRHEAQLLALAQDFDGAAAAFAALAQDAAPDSPELLIAQAHNLRRAGRSVDALQLLAQAPPASSRRSLPWLLERAIAAMASGEPLTASASAMEAAALASRLGWEHDEARAQLLLSDTAQLGVGGDATALLADAQRLFDIAGDRLGALRARYLADLVHGDAKALAQSLDQLLAEARGAGNVAVEYEALRRQAYHHYRAGEMAAYAERLAEAVAVADTAGDRYARAIATLDLLHLELMKGDVAAVDRHLAQLQALSPQGIPALWLSHFSAWIAYQRGDYAAALRILDRGERSAAGNSLPAAQMTGLSCLRGTVELARGESNLARNAFAQCRAPHVRHYLVYADVGEAELALQAGDPERSRRLLANARSGLSTLVSLPDRSKLILSLAPLMARTGDLAGARQLLQSQLDLLQRAGYSALLAEAQLGLAEIALAEGAVADAVAALNLSASGLAPDNWQAQRRLRTVRALLAQRRGDAAAAAQALQLLDADSRQHADVLGELLVHSLAQANPQATLCSTARHRQLLAQSGMRGASDLWLLKLPAKDVAAQLAATRIPH